jgi:hypothetical protein
VIEVEYDEPVLTTCECCGRENRQLFRTLWDGDVVRAYYMTTLPGHRGFPILVTVVWGNLVDEAPKSEKLMAAFRITDIGDGHSTNIVDADDSEIATSLTREQALAEHAKHLYAISDMILGQDPLVIEYFADRPSGTQH